MTGEPSTSSSQRADGVNKTADVITIVTAGRRSSTTASSDGDAILTTGGPYGRSDAAVMEGIKIAMIKAFTNVNRPMRMDMPALIEVYRH
jgi:hypothetical protein